jgi:DNA repair exonuclease SbcCD ATPase subunit
MTTDVVIQTSGNITFPDTAAKIAAKAAEYKALTIAGVNDAKGLKLVHDARMEVKTTRIAVEKRRVELKADALEYGKRVDAEAKRLTALLAPIEDDLEAKEKAIEDEKDRIKNAEKIAAAKKLADRMAALQAVEAYFTPDVVSGMTDEHFAKTVETARMALESRRAEAARLEAERLELERQKAEQELLAAERLKAEQAKLAAERAEFERQQREQREHQEAEARAERQRIEAEQKAERERLAEEQRRRDEELRAERERLQKIADEQEAERKRLAKIEADKLAEIARQQAEKQAELDRLEAERVARETAEAARIEAERIEKQRREAEERARPVREQLAAVANAVKEIAIANVPMPYRDAVALILTNAASDIAAIEVS